MPRPKPPAARQDDDVDDIITILLRQYAGAVGISVNETRKALRLGRDAVYGLLNKGEPDGLNSSLIGRRRIVHLDSIVRLLQRSRAKPHPRVHRIRHPKTSKPRTTCIARDDVQPPAATP